MSRDEYLTEIYRESGFMLSYERRKMMNYFRSYFIPGMDEEKVCSELGEPKEALKAYLAKGIPTKKTRAAEIVMYIAAIFAAPAAIFAGAAAVVIILMLGIAASVFMVMAPLAGIMLWLNGIADAVNILFSAVSAGDKLCTVGGGFISSAIGLLIMLGMVKLYRKFIPWLAEELNSSYRRIKGRIKKIR